MAIFYRAGGASLSASGSECPTAAPLRVAVRREGFTLTAWLCKRAKGLDVARIGGDELERALAEVSGWKAEPGVQTHGHPDEPERIFEWLQANGVDADAFAEFTRTRLPAESTDRLRPRTVYLQGFAIGFRAAQTAAERSALQIGKSEFERAEADDEFWDRI